MAIENLVSMFLSGNSVDLFTVLVSVLVIVLLSLVSLAVRCEFRRSAYSKLIPGEKVRLFNVFGNLSDIPLTEKGRNGQSFNAHFLQLLTQHTNLFRNNNLFLFWVSYAPFVVLVKSKAVEAFLSGTKNNEKSWTYNMLHPWLGTGLLTSHGQKWKSRRKLLTPAFHFDILKDFMPVMNEQSQVLVECLKKETTKDFTDMVPLITYCSLDIICETTLGVSVGAQKDNDSQYAKSVKRMSEIVMERMINVLHRSDFIFNRTKLGKEYQRHLNILHTFTRSVIQEKKEKLLKGDHEIEKSKRKPLMDLLLEHHIKTRDLTEEDIREEVDTFTFEGHDTTAMGMSWALYLIGLYKDAQAKIHTELDDIFGSDAQREVTTDDLNEMKYLERVLKESQRLCPSVPFFSRNITEESEICGFKLIKGATCVIPVYQLHRDEEVFPDPEKFDPDRFTPENSINRPHYAYIPFSAGPRNCIGQRLAIMEEKIVLANILRSYNLHSLDGREKVLPAPDLVLKPAKPLRIQIRPRF